MGLVGTLKGTFGCAAKALLLYSPFRRFLCVFVSNTLINGLFEVNCLKVTKCPLMVAADKEAAARKSSPATQQDFSFFRRLIKGFHGMEQFSHPGFLRGNK